MCNKYKTYPRSDMEEALTDRCTNGIHSLIIDVNWRTMDSLQSAAIIETLSYDNWFTLLSVKAVSGNKKMIEALGIFLQMNTTLTSLTISSVDTDSNVSELEKIQSLLK